MANRQAAFKAVNMFVFVCVCVCVCVCVLVCSCCRSRDRSVRVLQSSAAGHSGCGSGELSNRSSNVSLTFSSSKSLFSSLSHSLSLSLIVFSLLYSSPLSLSSQSFFMYFFTLSATLFSLFLSAFASLSLSLSKKRGSVEGSPQSSNTPIIAFWSLWHDEVCRGKATHNRVHAHSDTHTDLRKRNTWKYRNARERTHREPLAGRHTSSTQKTKKKHSEINTIKETYPNRNNCTKAWWSIEALQWKQNSLFSTMLLLCVTALTHRHTQCNKVAINITATYWQLATQVL